MRLTIIADDKTISIDQQNISPVEMPQLDSAIHAVQWYDTWGEVEFRTALTDGVPTKPANQTITDIAPYQWAVAAWNEAKAARDAEIAAAEAAAAAIVASEQQVTTTSALPANEA